MAKDASLFWWIHNWGVTIEAMTPFCHVSWILKQNECFKMLNNERGICMFMFSTNKCYNEWFKSIEQILNVLFKYKPKRNVRLNFFPKWHAFIWNAKTLLKTSINVFFLGPTFPILLSKLERNFIIKKIDFIFY